MKKDLGRRAQMLALDARVLVASFKSWVGGVVPKAEEVLREAPSPESQAIPSACWRESALPLGSPALGV